MGRVQERSFQGHTVRHANCVSSMGHNFIRRGSTPNGPKQSKCGMGCERKRTFLVNVNVTSRFLTQSSPNSVVNESLCTSIGCPTSSPIGGRCCEIKTHVVRGCANGETSTLKGPCHQRGSLFAQGWRDPKYTSSILQHGPSGIGP